MCEIISFISKNVDFANFFVTSLLTVILIYFTLRISKRQNELQKDINVQQNQLQKTISDREVKINLYQYRMNCYFQIMEALNIVYNIKLEDFFIAFQIGGSEYLKKLSKGQELMFKAYIESEPIFNDTIVQYIGSLYEKYNRLYIIFSGYIMFPDEKGARIKDALIKGVPLSSTDTLENCIIQITSFTKTEKGVSFLKDNIPEYEDFSAILKELGEVFKPKNDLIKLMGEYINVKELNKI